MGGPIVMRTAAAVPQMKASLLIAVAERRSTRAGGEERAEGRVCES
jgi:hypothetical protein